MIMKKCQKLQTRQRQTRWKGKFELQKDDNYLYESSTFFY